MRAIVTGVSGQDGYYITRRLLGDGYDVLGLTTNLSSAQDSLKDISNKRIRIELFDYTEPGRFANVVNSYKPRLIFNLAAKATGQGMFDSPYEICRLNGGFVVDILEAIRGAECSSEIGFCQASSSEMFGNVEEIPQSEETAFQPKSPYGAAKLYAHNMVNIYRSAYGLKVCSAILYNHESVRRSTQFVTKKIANAVARIKSGKLATLVLGTLDVRRDWGYAPEYADAMLLMAKADIPKDYIVATGTLTSIEELCEEAFGYVGLDYREYVKLDKTFVRPIESVDLMGDPKKIEDELGWQAQTHIKGIIAEMIDHELALLKCEN